MSRRVKTCLFLTCLSSILSFVLDERRGDPISGGSALASARHGLDVGRVGDAHLPWISRHLLFHELHLEMRRRNPVNIVNCRPQVNAEHRGPPFY